MIAAISLMRRCPDISVEQFRKHWLHPHGTMTAELPSLRHYVQHHPIEAPGTSAYARELAIDGVPELWFDDFEQRRIAYTSPRIAECNVDSEQFVGSVTRLVTEPEIVIAAPRSGKPVKVLLLATGAPDADWATRARARITALAGVTGYIGHRLIEQAAAPNSKIAELKLQIAGIAEATFTTEAALAAAGALIAGSDADAARTAVYRIADFLPPFPR
jgi:uncharacterized protein (TIGR02118 family)